MAQFALWTPYARQEQVYEKIDPIPGDPLVAFGNEDYDGYITVSFTLLCLCVVIDVGYTIISALLKSPHWRSTTQTAGIIRRRIYFFLLLSLVAFLVVNGFKLQFWRLKSTTWSNLKDFIDHLWDRMHTDPINRSPPRRFRSMVSQLKKWGMRGPKLHIDVLLWIRGRLPWFEDDLTMTDSVADYFKTLVSDPQRFWWTQQWFMGYTSWGFFVYSECYRRTISFSTIFSFVFLAYLCGLGSAQCLFYAFLLAKPRETVYRTFTVRRPRPIVVYFALASVALSLLPVMFGSEDERSNIVLVLIYLYVVLQPAIWFPPYMIFYEYFYFIKRRWLKRSIINAFFYASIMVFALHAYSSYNAFIATDDDRHYLFNMFSIPRERWRYYYHMRDDMIYLRASISTVLGDHHWIASVAFDVLFSAIGLCCWSVVGFVDVEGMIQCSFFPWLDETRDPVGHVFIQGHEEAHYEDIKKVGCLPNPGTSWKKRSAIERRPSDRHRLENRPEPEVTQQYFEWVDYLDGRPGRGAKSRARRRTRSPAGDALSRARNNAKRRSSRSQPLERGFLSSNILDDPDHSGDEEIITTTVAPTTEPAMGETEAAALTWGLFAIGGLGVASNAVFGAEEVF